MSSDTQAEAVQTPQERLRAAGEAFANVGKMMGGQLRLPDSLESIAAVDAVSRLLIEKGVLDEQEFVEAKVTRMAEIVEHLTEQARELCREASGLVIPGPGQPV